MKLLSQEWKETFTHPEQGWGNHKDYEFHHDKGRAPDQVIICLGPGYQEEEVDLKSKDRRWMFTHVDNNTMSLRLYKITPLPPKIFWTSKAPKDYIITIRMLWN